MAPGERARVCADLRRCRSSRNLVSDAEWARAEARIGLLRASMARRDGGSAQ